MQNNNAALRASSHSEMSDNSRSRVVECIPFRRAPFGPSFASAFRRLRQVRSHTSPYWPP